MTRTWTAVLFTAALLVVTVAAPAAADEEESGGFVITEHRSEVTVSEDGRLMVIEEIAVDFTEERHGIFRVIPLRYPADADDVPPTRPRTGVRRTTGASSRSAT